MNLLRNIIHVRNKTLSGRIFLFIIRPKFNKNFVDWLPIGTDESFVMPI